MSEPAEISEMRGCYDLRSFMQENVEGDSCDVCKPGTFFLEESNPVGCTKCFCFGTTDRCNSALIFRSQVGVAAVKKRPWERVLDFYRPEVLKLVDFEEPLSSLTES